MESGRLRRIIRPSAATVAVVVAFSIAVPANADDAVSFTDSDLAACVRAELGLPQGSAITASVLASLTTLECRGTGSGHIGSLVGLEHAVNLETADFTDNMSQAEGDMTWSERQALNFAMLTPLAGLPKLATLKIATYYQNLGYDLSVLSTMPALSDFATWYLTQDDLANIANVPSLTTLSVHDATAVTDISPLAGMAHLSDLELPDIRTLDLSPLAELPALARLSLVGANTNVLPPLGGLPDLREVMLGNSRLTSIAGLAGTKLERLDIRYSSVEDLAGLTDVSDLVDFEAGGSRISDLDELAGANVLATVDASYTFVTSLEPLRGLPALKTLNVEWNRIPNVDALADVPTLTTLNINRNAVASLEPLSQLPALATVEADNNELTDITPLAEIASLTTWTAWGQSSTIGPLARCVLAKVPVGTSIDGTTLFGTPTIYSDHSGSHLPGGTMFGDQSLLFNTGASPVALEASDPNHPFSVYRVSTGPVSSGLCAWPASFQPTLAIAGTGDVGTPFKATATWTGGPSTAPTVKYAHREAVSDVYPGPVSYFWDGDTVTPGAGWDEGSIFEFSATIELQGMDSKYLTAYSSQVWGKFPDFSPTLQGDATLATGGSIDMSSYFSSVAMQSLYVQNRTETYNWYVDGTFWLSTGDQPYVQPLPASLLGKKLSGTVTLSAPNYRTRTFTTPAKTIVRNFTSDYYLGSISGSRDVGSALKVNPLHWDHFTVAYKYQWSRDGVPIAGATSATYTPKSSDAGRRVSVVVTISKPGYETWTDTVATTIHKTFTAPIPKVTGSGKVGTALYASRGSWIPTPTKVSYQWYRDGKAIPGATSYKHTVVSADSGHYLKVKVTGSKTGYTTLAKISASVGAHR